MFTTENRKRKQEEKHHFSSSMPTNTSSWSDFIYSSPSSPANDNHNELNHLSFDFLLEHQQPSHQPHSQQQQRQQLQHVDTNMDSHNNQPESRRHSVAVGEMDYHSFDFIKQEPVNMSTMATNASTMSTWDQIQLLLNSTNTTGYHTNTQFMNIPQQQHPNRPIHKRTLSLREDDPNYATLLSPALSSSVSSTSPNFFTSSFLEALMSENSNQNNTDASTIISDMSFMDAASTTATGTAADLLSPSGDFFTINPSNGNENPTVTPSAITNEIHTMANWLLEQQEVKEKMQQIPHHQAQKRQRRSTNSLSPASPTNTFGSSLSSSMSPSPPITPMQPASLGFVEPLSNNNQNNASRHQQPTEGKDWEQQQQQQVLNKSSLISARMAQGETTAHSLKPLIQNYLMRREHQDASLPVAGERTVMVLTSRVAQKSYGTEKRFLCPPPTTILKGAQWWTQSNSNSASNGNNDTNDNKSSSLFHPSSSPTVLAAPKLTIHITGEAINQTGVIEWQTPNGTIMDSNPTTAAAHANNQPLSGKCVSKQLYINDADEKRKRVEVLAKLQLGNGIHLGTFPSKGIKVISKPSKKRQSVKNMELCIHHGTTISLFNRIRSQTVSTKYLGVSNGQMAASGSNNNSNNDANGTCFVARTGSWDPFVIWIVDTTRSPEQAAMPPRPCQHPTNPHFPPPPAIASQTPSTAQQPIAIHYNQPVVLQCVSTGLVSPVMVIRKVDKGSMVLGGNRVDDYSASTCNGGQKPVGGECGDETLGDPVSQLHKVAFQIVQDPTFSQQHPHALKQQQRFQTNTQQPVYNIPQSCHPITYLACLNDVVGMHKVNFNRNLLPHCQEQQQQQQQQQQQPNTPNNETTPATSGNVWTDLIQTTTNSLFDTSMLNNSPAKTTAGIAATTGRRRLSNDTKVGRRGSLATTGDRRGSTVSDTSGLEGACWTEDVSDAAVWTIVGTDCATYTFWSPSSSEPVSGDQASFNMPFSASNNNANAAPITPFPLIHDFKFKKTDENQLLITGENLTRDLNVWFGDIKSKQTEYKSRDSVICSIPTLPELMNSPTLQLDEENNKKVPLLLVRGDGVVYRTDQFYTFSS